jgi:hypothetical protein
MRSLCTKLFYFAGAFAMLALVVSAKADTLTLLGSSTPAYPGYPAADAIDVGPNSLLTDYASDGGGDSTHLDFAISGSADEITLYDRTTSGGDNGTYVGGVTDFTTEFELIFSDNADFSDPLATYTFSKSAPTNPTGPASFLFTTDFAPVDADYVRYQVISGGTNDGLADISFTGPASSSSATTPEPGGLFLLGTGVLGIVGTLRRRLTGK